MKPTNSLRCSAERTLIIGVALLSFGRVEEAVAQEIRIDPMFQAGYKYVFDQSMEQDTATKMSMAGLSDRSKESTNSVSTLSMDVASDGGDRRIVTASIDRIRGEATAPLSGNRIKFDTADVDGKSDFMELAKKGDIEALMSDMMHGLTGQKGEMVIENNELVKPDTGTDGEKLLFGFSLSNEAWIRLTVDFMRSGFPSDRVKRGAQWSRKVVYPISTNITNAGTPLEFHFTLDGIRSQGGGRGMLARISYQAELDSPITFESNDAGKRVSNVKGLTVTGTMHYDTEKRMFTQHDQSVGIAEDVALPDLGAEGSVTTKATLGLKLLSLEPGAGASDDSAGEERTDMIAERAWTDLQGRELTATLVSLESGVGKFRRNNGETFDYAVKKLSNADQTLIEETSRARDAKAEPASEKSE